MKPIVSIIAAISILMISSSGTVCAGPLLNLGSEEFVQAGSPPNDIVVSGYSVPSYVDWDSDGRNDLVIGEGGDGVPGKVRVYLNVGTTLTPQFDEYFYARSGGVDLVCPADSNLGCFPRVVEWNFDGRKDLLVGQADGTVKIFTNTGFDTAPRFDSGKVLRVGYPQYNDEDLDVGESAAATFVRWDYGSKTDVVAGAHDGKIHIYINCGCSSSAPAFYHSPPEGELATQEGNDLVVPGKGSSPVVLDLDGDGLIDLLTGNSAGQLLFYKNLGTEEIPDFSAPSAVKSEGVPIELGHGSWSRPFVCDWTGDGYLDVLVGASDGKVHLYQGRWQLHDLDGDLDFDWADFAVLALAWQTQPGDANWNPACDIWEPGDEIIDEYDLGVLAENWLTELER